ncbi:hypothetical protein PVAND_013816 [Polypedilum vanderplanki]|uniref:Uncharacterized protein n=1 Tax=Polypedilum vanderplanki TaxID=319348 RepID=A0A9J6CRV8_POLVA|nr:hypothetical protein PVAND_013816 [Polypedilum vanderplanki]
MKALLLLSVVIVLILKCQGREIRTQCAFFNPLLNNFCNSATDKKVNFENIVRFSEKDDNIENSDKRYKEELLNNEPFIQCAYQFLTSFDVSCIMSIYNPQENNFDRIEGNLPPIATFNQVTYVWIIGQHTVNIPTIICQQFPQLLFLDITSSRLNTINENSFTFCNNLQYIFLASNEILTIPDNTFGNNLRNVFSILLTFNQLKTISSRSFSNEVLTSLNSFEADSNFIESIDPNWFDTANNLTYLNLINNLCVNQNFLNVHLNRSEVRSNLTECFNNYGNVETTTTTSTTTTTTSSPNESFIRCSYQLWGNEVSCELTIYNPFGRNDFTEIEGTLPPGTSYNQVTIVIASHQLTSNIPGIICRLFPQLSLLRIQSSQVYIVNQESFEACQNAFEIYLPGNNITEIGTNTFGNNLRTLGIIDLGFNHLKKISLSSFGSESIATLITVYLDSNVIDAIDPNWFDSAINLLNLDLSFNLCTSQYFDNINQNRDQVRGALLTCFENYEGNEITTISTTSIQPDQDFIRCTYDFFEENELFCILNIHNPNGRNDFNEIEGTLPPNTNFNQVKWVSTIFQLTTNVPSIICYQFPELTILELVSCQITTIDHHSFAGCNNMRLLNIFLNNITHIPDSTFGSNLRNFERIDISENQLQTLSFESFSTEFLNSLVSFMADLNFINEIDPKWFDSSVALRQLNLNSNLCVNQSFDHFTHTREQVRDVLMPCFENYENRETTTIMPDDTFIRCDYGFREMNETFCVLSIYNPNGRNDFNRIEGDLPSGISYNQIRYVQAVSQWTSNVPTRICQQFPQLQSLGIWASNVTFINYESFKFCDNIFEILLGFNDISYIPARTFDNNMWNLRNINFGYNKLTTLSLNSFGHNIASLVWVYLHFNSINAIESNWFDSTQNLTLLDFRNNFCANQIFFDIHINRNQVRNQLINCFANYDLQQTTTPPIAPDETFIRCNYTFWRPDEIRCEMTIFNINGNNNFDNIEGTLPINGTYDQVLFVYMNRQYTTNVPSIICKQFTRLIQLEMWYSHVNFLNHESFQFCNNIDLISLSGNHITRIGDGTFGSSLRNLKTIHFFDNQITRLNFRSFSRESFEQLTRMHFDSNFINAIDPELFDSASSLFVLNLRNNLCISDSFFDVGQNRSGVKNALKRCFENYEFDEPADGSFIRCRYITFDDEVSCEMSIYNPNGRNDFREIEGLLPPNLNYNQIIDVVMFNETTTNVPSIICRQFTNLKLLSFWVSGINFINHESFESCDNIEKIILPGNNIFHIGENTFGNNLGSLRVINLEYNQISTISFSSFGSQSIQKLNSFIISSNLINAIDLNWFDSATSLAFLDLEKNVCIDKLFIDVNLHQQEVRNQLISCFNNYVNTGTTIANTI